MERKQLTWLELLECEAVLFLFLVVLFWLA
jgi:hypothetical protein